MLTDDFGQEIARPSPNDAVLVRCGRLFTLGVAVGIGLCIGMGPPLPLIDEAFFARVHGEQAGPTTHLLPRRWLVMRDTMRVPSVAAQALAEEDADAQLLRDKWWRLNGALARAWSAPLAER